MRILEVLPEENLIFPDEPMDKIPDSPFPDFCCLDCPHLDTAFRQPLTGDDPCLRCRKGNPEPIQQELNHEIETAL
jgi:hypothetical protein